jgi:hypothetical protein
MGKGRNCSIEAFEVVVCLRCTLFTPGLKPKERFFSFVQIRKRDLQAPNEDVVDLRVLFFLMGLMEVRGI